MNNQEIPYDHALNALMDARHMVISARSETAKSLRRMQLAEPAQLHTWATEYAINDAAQKMAEKAYQNIVCMFLQSNVAIPPRLVLED